MHTKKGKKVAINTHIEVICAWVINHLNEIDYIWMVQHFHDQNLQRKGYE